jgi:hypothetical protein
MSTKQDTPAETPETPAVETITPENQTTAERIRILNLTDAKVDVDAFDAAVAAVVDFFPTVHLTERQAVLAKIRLANLIMDVRHSVTLPNGEKDSYGKSSTYRTLFEKEIVAPIFRAHPDLPVEWITRTLRTVRTNYLNSTSTGGRDIVTERVLTDAVESGKVPHAVVQHAEDGQVSIVIEDHFKNGTPQTVKDPETGEKVQKVTTYVPGTPGSPEVLKDVVRDSIVKRGRKDQKVPVVYGGPAKDTGGGGGGDGKNPPDYGKQYRDALAIITASGEHVSLMAQAEFLHAAMTTFVRSINARRTEAVPAQLTPVLDDVHGLCKTESAVLNAKDDAGREAAFKALAAFEWVPKDETKQDATPETESETESETTPETTPETESDDDAAADAAAVAATENGS